MFSSFFAGHSRCQNYVAGGPCDYLMDRGHRTRYQTRLHDVQWRDLEDAIINRHRAPKMVTDREAVG
jgi:hypothetical protein